jgi:tetratricopeptide (TPR) repeat protein
MVESEMKKKWSFELLPSLLITALAFLLPIIFLPLNLASIDATKSLIFIIGTLSALFVWLILRLKDNSFKLPYNLLSLSILLVPVTYLIGSFFSTNFNVSMFGSGFIFDSVINVTVAFLLVGLVTVVFQNIKHSYLLYMAIISSVLVVTLLNLIKLPLINFFPTFNFFFSPITNTIGSWYDLAIFAGLGLIISVISVEMFKVTKVLRVTLYTTIVLSLITLILVNFRDLWFIVFLVSLLSFVYIFINNRLNKINKAPVLSLAVFLITFFFIIAGGKISPVINNYFGIDFVEARPNFAVTLQVVKDSVAKKPIFGYGPSRFDIAWNENKPADVNISDFWSTDFKFGYGFIPSLVVNVGLLGILFWILFFGLYLFVGFKTILKKDLENESRFLLASSFTASVYLWIMSFIYVPNIVTFALTSIFTGVFVAALYREEILKTKKINIIANPRLGFIYIFVLILLLVGIITIGYISVSRFLGDVYFQKANIAFNSNQKDVALTNFVKALQFEQSDFYLRTFSNIENVQLTDIANNKDLSDEDRVSAFQQTLTTTIQAANAAIAYDPQNYNNYLNVGSIYESLLPLKIEGVSDQAKQNYLNAKDKNPTNPAIILALARLEIGNKNYDEARKLIDQSLKLKSNYTEAVYLLAQIDVLEGKIKEAIAKVEQAVLIKPNDPLVYFQLGLLRYQDKQYASAANAFEKAVIRNPYYANAKYFLGLSYYQTNRAQDAILQFEDLVMLNPDSAEIKDALDKMKAGTFSLENQSSDNVSELPIKEDKNKEE